MTGPLRHLGADRPLHRHGRVPRRRSSPSTSGRGAPSVSAPALWQGIYFSLGAGLCLAALSPLAGPVFALGGPCARACARYETGYAADPDAGRLPVVLMATLSTFFAGRGQTRVVLLVKSCHRSSTSCSTSSGSSAAAASRAWGSPARRGPTVVSQCFGALLSTCVLILRPRFRRAYRTLSGWRLDRRLLRAPAALRAAHGPAVLARDPGASRIFMMIVGRLGTEPLAATGIAFNLNMLVFMPMLGLGMGVSSLVGRYLGAERPDLAERGTWSAFWMSLVYMGVCGAALRAGAPACCWRPTGRPPTRTLRGGRDDWPWCCCASWPSTRSST